MQDNYEGGLSVQATVPWENSPFDNCPFQFDGGDPCLQEWKATGTGPYGEGAAPLAFTFRSSVSPNKDADILAFGAPGFSFRGFFPGYGSVHVPPTEWFWSAVTMLPGNDAGTVKLRSKDPRDMPEINFNWFEKEGDRDLQAMAETLLLAMRAFNATGPPYAPYKVLEPDLSDLDKMKQSIKDTAFSHHVVGTCRMGPRNNKDYCVDSNFRVNFVEGLRVVDASIFPHNPGSMPALPTFMISHKAAEAILKDARGDFGEQKQQYGFQDNLGNMGSSE